MDEITNVNSCLFQRAFFWTGEALKNIEDNQKSR